MGGALSLVSKPPEGCTFTLRLPLPRSAPAAAQRSQGRVMALEEGQVAPRVLIVDDQPDNRELVRQMLEHVGFEVQAAKDGQQAHRRCRILCVR